MKGTLIPILLLLTISTFAQQVQNVMATQQGSTVIVTYDIIDQQQNRPYYVKLLMSRNGSQKFSEELKFVTGDVRNTKAGINKRINWDAARELSYYDGSAIFRIEATPKTTALPQSVENQVGKVEITNIKGVGSRIIVDFIFKPFKDGRYYIYSSGSFAFDSSGNKKTLESSKLGNVTDSHSKDLLAGIPIKAQVVFSFNDTNDTNDTIIPLLKIRIPSGSFEFRNISISR